MQSQERADWLAERRKGLGSSDAPAICLPRGTPGVFRTQLHVYLDKAGELPEQSRPELAWGLKLEEAIACAFSEETGHEVAPGGGLHTHAMLPWMLATPDRFVPTEKAVLELKNSFTSEGWGHVGGDDVPIGYKVQVHHQMEVLNLDLAYVAVLIGGRDFRWYRVERDQALVDLMLRLEEEFWGRVLLRQPPPPDYEHPDTPELLALLHRPVEGAGAVELDALAAMTVDEYQELGKEIGELEARRKRCRAEIDELMRDASLATLLDGRTLRRKVTTVKGHWREESTSVRLTVTNPKGDRV